MRFTSAIFTTLFVSFGPLAGSAQPGHGNGSGRGGGGGGGRMKRVKALDSFSETITVEGEGAHVLLEGLDIGGESPGLDLVAMSAFSGTSTYKACDDCLPEPILDTGVQIMATSPTSSDGFFTVLAVDKQTGSTNGISFDKKGKGKLYGVRQNKRGKPMAAKEESTYSDPTWKPNEPINPFPGRNRGLRTASDVIDTPNLEEELNNRFQKDGLKFKQAKRRLQSGYYTDSGGAYSYQVDLVIDVDPAFVSDSGGSFSAALAYVDLLVSAANTAYEKEVDTHLNVEQVVQTNRYNSYNDVGPCLDALQNHYSSGSNWAPGVELHHALLGRNLGGGVAYLGAMCDTDYGYGVSAGITGQYQGPAGIVMWDITVFAHELGHNFNADHTHESYSPRVDNCGNNQCGGFPEVGAASLMSYCHLCNGGETNIALSLGGYRTTATNWVNDPTITAGGISNSPFQVAKVMYEHVSSQGGTCADLPNNPSTPPPTPVPTPFPTPSPTPAPNSPPGPTEDPPSAAPVGSPPSSGDLVFFEILPNPIYDTDADGEYVALWNPTDSVITFNGEYQLCRQRQNRCITLTGSLYPNYVWIGCRNWNNPYYAMCDQDTNFGLSNSNPDTLQIKKNGVVIESITYGNANGANAQMCWMDWYSPGNWGYDECFFWM